MSITRAKAMAVLLPVMESLSAHVQINVMKWINVAVRISTKMSVGLISDEVCLGICDRKDVCGSMPGTLCSEISPSLNNTQGDNNSCNYACFCPDGTYRRCEPCPQREYSDSIDAFDERFWCFVSHHCYNNHFNNFTITHNNDDNNNTNSNHHHHRNHNNNAHHYSDNNHDHYSSFRIKISSMMTIFTSGQCAYTLHFLWYLFSTIRTSEFHSSRLSLLLSTRFSPFACIHFISIYRGKKFD